jgi:outer membrane biosynthesis protein TonB
MASNNKPIAVALIGAAAVIIAALIGYFATHHDSALVPYTGKVKDAKSYKPVGNASVAITEDQRVPQRFTTDSEGVFFAQLSKDTQTMLLEVKADGYKDYSRRGPTVRTGSEEIFLEPVQPPEKQSIQPPVQQPVQQSVQQPVQQPAQQPIQQPVQQPVQQSVQQPEKKPIAVSSKTKENQKEDVATPSAQDFEDEQNEAKAHNYEVAGDYDANQSIAYMYRGLQGFNGTPPNQTDVAHARELWTEAISRWKSAYNITHNDSYADRLLEKTRPEHGVSCDDQSCEPNYTHENRSNGIHIPTNLFDPQ